MVQSKVKKEINAVCQLWDATPFVRNNAYAGNPRVVAEEFYKGLKRLGWKPIPDDDMGCFKIVYRKGNIILKFLQEQNEKSYRESGMDTEWRIWRRASPYKKRFIARCYEYYDWCLLFQERVPRLCYKYDECKLGEDMASRFRIHDWTHNHGHKNGRPVFFDYDSGGDGWAWFNYQKYRKRKKSGARRKYML